MTFEAERRPPIAVVRDEVVQSTHDSFFCRKKIVMNVEKTEALSIYNITALGRALTCRDL